MIISHIIGGLGNQMFQYAAGRALSLKCECDLLLDISAFTNYGLHQGFELQRVFNCTTGIATETDVRKVLGWQSPSFVRRIVLRSSMEKFRSEEFVVEPHFQYWSGINDLTEDCICMDIGKLRNTLLLRLNRFEKTLHSNCQWKAIMLN